MRAAHNILRELAIWAAIFMASMTLHGQVIFTPIENPLHTDIAEQGMEGRYLRVLAKTKIVTYSIIGVDTVKDSVFMNKRKWLNIHKLELDTSKLEPGRYLITLNINRKLYCLRLVILNMRDESIFKDGG